MTWWRVLEKFKVVGGASTWSPLRAEQAGGARLRHRLENSRYTEQFLPASPQQLSALLL